MSGTDLPGSARFCVRCATALVRRAEAGRERPLCPACGWVSYGNPVPVVAALVELVEEQAVLLVRAHGWPDKLFGLVTGYLEAGEDPEAGVLRELREEVGLAGEVVGLIGAYRFELKNELIVAYHVRAAGEVVLGDEIAAVKRVPVAKLRPWPLGTGHAVRDWLARRRPSPDPAPGA